MDISCRCRRLFLRRLGAIPTVSRLVSTACSERLPAKDSPQHHRLDPRRSRPNGRTDALAESLTRFLATFHRCHDLALCPRPSRAARSNRSRNNRTQAMGSQNRHHPRRHHHPLAPASPSYTSLAFYPHHLCRPRHAGRLPRVYRCRWLSHPHQYGYRPNPRRCHASSCDLH